MPARRHRVGVIGCGNISRAYLKLAPAFRNFEIAAVADQDVDVARTIARRFGLVARTVEAVLGDPDIEAVVNLTNPAAHFAVSRAIVKAGKHAYSEKPLTVTMRQAKALLGEAGRRGVALGAAPDTFLGAAVQTARTLVDAGEIGKIIAGTAVFMDHGPEGWHPQPLSYYQPGHGPWFSLGPYYLTALVTLLGSVTSVSGMTATGFTQRIATARGPLRGTTFRVETPTTVGALVEFECAAVIACIFSYDVWRHGHVHPLELYGTEGTMLLPDPNFFGGTIRISRRDGRLRDVPTATKPFGRPNWEKGTANYRGAGLADLLDAVEQGREPRASGELALHVLEILEAALEAGRRGRRVTLRTTVARPSPLTKGDATRLAAEVR